MKLKTRVENQSPTILAILGCLGFISATIMTAKAAPKAKEILENQDLKLKRWPEPRDATLLEKIRVVTPIYAPTVGMILLSTGCIVASNRVHRYRYASLLALYSIGEKSLQRWQSAIIDEVGPKKYENVKERVLKPDKPVPEPVYVGKDKVLFFDNFTGRYFTASSVETVRKIVNDMNDQLFADDFISINEFYFELGLPPTEFGDSIGWHVSDGSIKVEFIAFIVHDAPAISVTFDVKPRNY
jgi:hypothetical protein